MRNGSLIFIPLGERKKLITLNFSPARYRRGDEWATRLSVFIQNLCKICNMPWHPFRVLKFGSFSAVPCFRIWGHFPLFRVLGFGVIFRHSAIPLFRHSAIPPFRHSTIPPFYHSTIPPFYHSTILPFHHSTILPFYHSTILPFYHSTILQFQLLGSPRCLKGKILRQ